MIQTLDLDYTQVFSELGRHCRYIKSWFFSYQSEAIIGSTLLILKRVDIEKA